MPTIPRSRRRLSLAVPAIAACALVLAARAAQAAPPYPPSQSMTGMTLDWSTYRRVAPGSDNWPTTWAGDGLVYTSFGDGAGFGGGRVSLGFARLAGSSARTVRGVNLPGEAPDGKSYGVLALGRTLYAFVSPGSGAANYQEARLHAAPLGTNAWQAAGWAFTKDDPARLILPTFLQAGRDYADAGPYVYAYAPRHAPAGSGLSIQDGPDGGEIALLRAPKADLMSRASWRYFAGLDAGGRPRWSSDPEAVSPVITDPSGVGWTVSAIYDRPLGRYLVATEHAASFASRFTLLEAPEPWGPWRTVAYTTLVDPQGRVEPRSFHHDFLPNSLSADGKRFTLAFTGQGDGDALNLVDGVFTAAPPRRGTSR